MNDFFSKMVHRETTIYAEYDDALNYEKNEQVIAPHEKTRRDFQIRPRISKRGSVRRFVRMSIPPARKNSFYGNFRPWRDPAANQLIFQLMFVCLSVPHVSHTVSVKFTSCSDSVRTHRCLIGFNCFI